MTTTIAPYSEFTLSTDNTWTGVNTFTQPPVFSSFTQGSVFFAGAGGVLSEDNANFFWDNVNKRLGIGISSPLAPIHLETPIILQNGAMDTLQEFGGGNFSTGDTVNYRLYAYKIINGVKVYTTASEGNELTVTGSSVGIFVSWEPATGADGYKLVRNYNGAGFVEEYDLGGGTFTDDNDPSLFTSPVTVTPLVSNLHVYLNYFDSTTYWGIHTNESGHIGIDLEVLNNVSVGNNLTVTNYATISGRLGVGITPTIAFQLLSGSSGGMGFPYEVAVFEKGGDTKLGVYTSSSAISEGVSIVLGYTNAVNALGRHPGFEFQMIGGSTDTASYIRYNYLERDSGGNVVGAFVNVIALTGDGRVGIGTATPGAKLELPAGSTSLGPLKFVSGSLLTSPVVGLFEFLSDKVYFTISTGTARKEFTLNDSALTSGRIPFATTNGRLNDSASFTFSGSTLTVTNIAATTFTGDITVSTKNIISDTVTGTKIGTGTTQKLGFFNATPVVQQAAATDLGTVLSNLGLRVAGTAYPITTSGAVNFTGGVTIATTNLTITDKDVVLGTTTGTKFGTATSQKLAFYNSTPIIQPLATTDLGTVLSNLGLRAAGTAYPITTSGAVSFTGGVTISTAALTITDQNIVLGTTTGTKIGTATTQKLGFFNATPVVQPSAYTVTNPVTDRAYDTTSTTLTEVAQVLGTLIADLKSLGLVG